VVAVLVLVAVATAVGLHLATDPEPSSAPVRPEQISAPATPESPGSTPSAGPDAHDRPRAATTPEDFARQVAVTLFSWDTTVHSPDAITEQILAVADPTGVETPGLMTDLEVYLPEAAWWGQLRQYEAVQWFDVESAVVPDAWTEARAGSATDGLVPGTTAVTVTGTLHRAGNVAGQRETASAPLVLTVFVACTDQDGCALLRIGGPGKALDNERLH